MEFLTYTSSPRRSTPLLDPSPSSVRIGMEVPAPDGCDDWRRRVSDTRPGGVEMIRGVEMIGGRRDV
jgi:hypothetical protein